MPEYTEGDMLTLDFGVIEILNVSKNKDIFKKDYIYFVENLNKGTYSTYSEKFIKKHINGSGIIE